MRLVLPLALSLVALMPAVASARPFSTQPDDRPWGRGTLMPSLALGGSFYRGGGGSLLLGAGLTYFAVNNLGISFNVRNLTTFLVGRVLRLSWDLGGGNAESYVLEAGTSSGAANIATLDTGALDTDFTAPMPPGTYFLRVRARNSFGTSAPSNEVTFVVP